MNWLQTFLDNLPPLQVFFFSMIFETFFMAYVSTRLLNILATNRQLIIMALSNALVGYIMRAEPINSVIVSHGLHVFILVFTMTLIMSYTLKISWRIAFVAVAMGEIIVLLGDMVILSNVMKIFGEIPIQDLPKHLAKWIAYGWASNGILISLAILIKVKKFSLFRFPITDTELESTE